MLIVMILDMFGIQHPCWSCNNIPINQPDFTDRERVRLRAANVVFGTWIGIESLD